MSVMNKLLMTCVMKRLVLMSSCFVLVVVFPAAPSIRRLHCRESWKKTWKRLQICPNSLITKGGAGLNVVVKGHCDLASCFGQN